MSHFALWCNLRYWGIFFTFFFYQILPVHDSESNLWNSRSITIISLPPVRPVRTAGAVDRGPASSSCWPIALLAESGCRSTASVHLQGNKIYSIRLSVTFFMFFFSILLPLQIGSSDNIHPLFTCFSPWSLIITFLLSLILLIIHVYDEPTQPMLWESSFVEMIPNMFS